MLIISHLHQDHVNGIDELLEKFSVGTVFLPYLSPIERLLIAVRENIRWTKDFYIPFLEDPVKFLLDRGVDRVILIGGGGGEQQGPEGRGGGGTPPSSSENKGEKIHLKLNDDEVLKKKIEKNEDSLWMEFFKEGKVLLKSHYGYIEAVGAWRFRFFNHKITLHELKDFLECVRNIGCTNTKSCISDKVKRVELKKKCYETILRSLGENKSLRLNNGSLVVYNAPLFPKYSMIKIECFRDLLCIPWHLFSNYSQHLPQLCFSNQSGHFLTGDVNLKFKYKELLEHFNNELKNICISTVPHHGSENNWNNQILSVTNCPFWIINAGIDNSYGHPSVDVLKNLIDGGRYAMWVNEKNRVTIGQDVQW